MMPSDNSRVVGELARANEYSTAPAARKRKAKAPTIRTEDWKPFQSRIVRLYSVENRTIPEIDEIMKQEFGEHFTHRQLRSLLTGLGLDKNVKKPEYQAIIRKNQRRKLVEPDKRQLAHRVRGVFVEPANVERWMRRYGIKQDQLYSPSSPAATPAALSTWTISDRGSPAPTPATLIGSPSVPVARLPSGSGNQRGPNDLPVDSVEKSIEQSHWDAGLNHALDDSASRCQFQMNLINLPSVGNDNIVQYDQTLPATERHDGVMVGLNEVKRLQNPEHLSSEAWENSQDGISRLHPVLLTRSKEKEETVMSFMERRHNFITTRNQYKERLSMWGLDTRKVKAKVKAKAVKGKARKRESPKIEFGQYKGDSVNGTKFVRLANRRTNPLSSADQCVTHPTLRSISISTPQTIEAWAPSPLDELALAYRKSIQYSDIPSPLLSLCRSSKAAFSPLSAALLHSTTTDITCTGFTGYINWQNFITGLETIWIREHDQNLYRSPKETRLIRMLRTTDWHQDETLDMLAVENLRSLGLIYHDQGKFQLAEMVQLRSALLLFNRRGASNGAYMAVLDNLLDILMAQGRFAEVVDLGKYIWHIRLADSRQASSALELATMNNLAFSYLQLRKNDEANSLLLEVLDWRKFIGNNSGPILRAMSYLGNLFRRRGQFEDAANLKRCVLDVKVESAGEYSLETTASRANLARVYLEQGLLDRAEDMYLQNWKILRHSLPDEHVDVAYCLYCLAKVSVARFEWLKALDYASRASEMYRIVVGEEHAWTLVCMGYMIDAYRGLGQLDHAREFGDMTYSRAQRYLGEDHDTTLRIKMSLALTYAEQGRLSENESLQIELIEAKPRVYDDNPLI